MDEIKDSSYTPIRILSIDGSDIYRSMHRIDGNNGLSIKDKRGKLDTHRFRGFLDPSLDADRIKQVYSKHKELPGSFKVCKEYTTAVVNVTFDYSVKQYYNKGKFLYIRDGYDVSWDELTDHVLVGEENGVSTLIAIEVGDDIKSYKRKKRLAKLKDDTEEEELETEKNYVGYSPVVAPLSPEVLGEYFYYDEDDRAYYVRRKLNSNGEPTAETHIPSIQNKRKVRSWLYENGFDADGIHYVRYKRSAGSSREGHCLFIAEPLYDDMMEWSGCGLSSESVGDQASWQAYISLTLSSIEKKIHIPRQSILLLKDQYSCFRDKVVRVSECNGGLSATEEEVEIKNAIWDGEALLDSSVFNENGYGSKGMMLLRNRFFKTCAFNTNLQEWFADNGITKPSQLNGYCSSRTRSISDIKLVITESSLKYLKFKPKDVSIGDWFERWMDNIYVDKENSLFGVVKTDKATGPMGNRMVRTNYQLLNTLEMSEKDTEDLLEQSLDFLHKMQANPLYVRYYSGLYATDTYDDESPATDNYRQRLISDIMRRTDNFEGTVFYRDYRSELCRSFKKKLKLGRILINGGYHTLLGNGMELLRSAIDKNYTVDKPIALVGDEIYAPDFADGEELLCERSPHITMGNLFLAKNKRVEDIDRYFNLGVARSIVCVNAIESNLQQRLNGCDYDSDSMLITDNPILRNAVKNNYSNFLVPYCDVIPGGSVLYTTSPSDLAELDVKISENKIGEIVNLSQFLNSLYWDRLSKGETDGINDLYADICKLAVLSGMEIDKAKRLFNVSADSVLSELRAYKEDYKNEHDKKIPAFFDFITDGDGGDTVSNEAKLNTAMSFVYEAVCNDRGRAPRSKTVYYTDLFDLNFQKGDPNGTYAKRRDSILKTVEDAQGKIKHLNFISKNRNRSEKLLAIEEAESLFTECMEKVGKLVDDHVYDLLLRELDKGEESDKRVSAFHSLLFAVICYANDGYLMKKLRKTEGEIFDLIPVYSFDWAKSLYENTVTVYGYPHIMGRRRK